RRYGKALKGDYFTLNQVLEIKNAIVAQAWITRPMGWSARSPDNFSANRPEKNTRLVGDDFAASDDHAEIQLVNGRWADTATFPPFENSFDLGIGSTQFGGDVGQPFAFWEWVFGGPYRIHRRYAYGTTSS